MRVRVCVCCARAAGVCCVLYSVVRLFVQLGGAALAGRAARWAAACCGWSCACLMVCGGRAARSTGPSAAQGASMPMRAACEAAARLARKFPCGEGRAHVFTLRARAGVEGGAVSPRSDAGWSLACRGRARKRPCRHRVAAKGKNNGEKTFTTKLPRTTYATGAGITPRHAPRPPHARPPPLPELAPARPCSAHRLSPFLSPHGSLLGSRAACYSCVLCYAMRGGRSSHPAALVSHSAEALT